jgi:hypothetical protein
MPEHEQCVLLPIGPGSPRFLVLPNASIARLKIGKAPTKFQQGRYVNSRGLPLFFEACYSGKVVNINNSHACFDCRL